MHRRRLFSLWFAVAAFASPGRLSAQHRLRGLAYDSLLDRPLAGATVWLQQLDRTVRTDSQGRFVIDKVPPGHYVLALAHPDLDSAGLPSVAAEVEVSDAPTPPAILAIPAIRTWWRRLCGASRLRSDSGIIIGEVRDVDSGVLLPGVSVELSWLELQAADPKHVTVETRTATGTTDSAGVYHICGVGTGVAVRATAFAGTLSTGVVQWAAAPLPVSRRDLALSRVAADSGAVLATLQGRVHTESGHPVPGASIAIDGADSARSDGNGRFTLIGIPGGSRWLRVRAVGFGPLERAIDVRSRDTTTVDLTMWASSLLDTINVSPRLSQEMREFDERRKVGLGYSLSEREVQGRPDIEAVFRGLPSMVISGRSAASIIGYMRSSGVLRRYCVVNVFVDGAISNWTQLSTYTPREIVAIEFYARQSVVPARFKLTSECGTVLVWTKALR